MSEQFWSERWQNNQTGWDLGAVSPPIKTYVDQLTNKGLKILIPGCGNAYEAEYLFENGFANVFIAEIAQEAIDSFQQRYPKFPQNQILHTDFFDLKDKFDLVIEQTFFCAITPNLRDDYVKKMHEILAPKGKIVGLLFNRSFNGGPPYGGDTAEYHKRFEPFFTINTMEIAHNSFPARQGSEVFINLQAK